MAKKKKKRRLRKRTRNRIIFGVICTLILVICVNIVSFTIKTIKNIFVKEEITTEMVSEEVKQDNVVSFMGVGDNLIHSNIFNDAKNEDGYDFTKMYKNFSKDAKQADIAFINQETILGGEELILSGYPNFNSPSEIAKNLEDTGFNLVNLATNHSLDRYEQGIENELETFRDTDMVFDGVYDSEQAYNTIPTFEKKGITFSFLAYTYGTNGIVPNYDYNVSYLDEDSIRDEVNRAKEISDVVIVSSHWGDENTFEPNEYQKYYAQLFADCGVDVVIGTHPHVIQPVEWITGENGNKMLCVYSLGNFMGGMLSSENIVGGMIQFDFVQKEDDITIENVKWTPTIIHFEGNQNNIMDERDHFKCYKIDQYSDSLAKKHVLNGFEGNEVSIEYIMSLTEDVIDEEFLK